jgi:hypothetical protein
MALLISFSIEAIDPALPDAFPSWPSELYTRISAMVLSIGIIVHNGGDAVESQLTTRLWVCST